MDIQLMRFLLFALMALFLPLTAGAQPQLAGAAVRISPAEQPLQQPIWSPAGEWIAATGARYTGIYLLRPDGSEFRQLTDDPAAGFKMDWAGDGSAIVARAARWDRGRRYNSVKVYDVASGTATQISEERTMMPATPFWGGSNYQIYLFADKELERFEIPQSLQSRPKQAAAEPLVLHAEQGIELRQSDGELIRTLQPVEGRYLNIKKSPVGGKLAFEVIGGNLYVCDMDGSGLVDFGRGERPSWSPDGEWLAYMVTQDDGHRMLGADIYVARVDGTAITNLTNSDDALEMNPAWSPAGNAIAYDEERSGGIFLLRLVF